MQEIKRKKELDIQGYHIHNRPTKKNRGYCLDEVMDE